MDYMDIAGLSTVLSQTKIMDDVGTAMLSKSLDNFKVAGAELVNMIDAASMERSVNPFVGGMIDVSV